MTVVSHEPSPLGHRQGVPWSQLLGRELWASLAISVIWLAVLFDSVFGPNIYTASPDGSASTIPSAVVVAFFAFLATWLIAKYGLRQRRS